MILDDCDVDRTWFTADQHFGHENIIRYCNRPFSDIEEMDKALIARWNEVVKPTHTVFHLGDFTLGDYDQAAEYLSELNGHIYMLKNDWHHDKRWLRQAEVYSDLRSRDDFITLIPPLFVLEVPSLGKDGYPLAITLCHYPLAEWDRKHYGAWHLYGHSHGNYQTGDFAIDVGVDVMIYFPVSLNGILHLMYERNWMP